MSDAVTLGNDFEAAKAEAAPSKSYIVVTKTLSGSSAGVMTWSSYESKEAFEQWYAGKMLDGTDQPISHVYAVVAQGISVDEAVEIMKSPSNTQAIFISYVREIADTMRRVDEALPSEM